MRPRKKREGKGLPQTVTEGMFGKNQGIDRKGV